MKAIIKISLLTFLLLFCLKCISNESESGFTPGTVKYQSIEGGFYGIVTDDNKNLDPINLSSEFKVDGKRIQFKYVERKDLASFHMWGMLIEITEIKELK